MNLTRPLFLLSLFSAMAMALDPLIAGEDEHDPPEIAIGERLFLETRFAQSYAVNPEQGDPVMERTVTLVDPLPGPFAGQGMNCRACHMVDEHAEAAGGGMRSYSDFARLSPQPLRAEDPTPTRPRNAQSLIGISLARGDGTVFHHDGQFATLEDLVSTTFTGREFGWMPDEEEAARRHIATVVRTDDGSGELAQEFGGAYRIVLQGTDPALPAHLRLPPEYRIDVTTASEREILDAISRLVAAYVADLGFSRDDSGQFDGSPYDRFLELNGLPRAPANNESETDYGRRLLRAVETLDEPRFVTDSDGAFATHEQSFVFGPRELRGLKLFFRRGSSALAGGNCVACHSAPNFSDFHFHNTGVTQLGYDRLHGDGSFARLEIPDLATRSADPEAYLPRTPQHPNASDRFRSTASGEKPGHTDLGLWNIYANPDFTGPQQALQNRLCTQELDDCSQAALLPRTIALFKTPVLRDLGHSAPYMHDGSRDRLEDVITFYIDSAARARAGVLRNGDEELEAIHIGSSDIVPLAAFLRALNEDYD